MCVCFDVPLSPTSLFDVSKLVVLWIKQLTRSLQSVVD